MKQELRTEDRAISHVGLIRSENEDSHVSLAEAQVWAVADGMGGHENGRLASQLIISELTQASLPEELREVVNVVAAALQAANTKILATAQESGGTMGSTVVVLIVRGTEFAVLWAGDSRAYLFRDDRLVALTRDHSQVQELIDRGMLSPEQSEDHPMRHVLARAVGVQSELEIDAVRDTIQVGDLFLLCSDGLHGVISEEEIAEIVRRHGNNSAQPLIEACLERGAPDNVTVTLVHVTEPTLLVIGGGQVIE